MTHSLSDIAQQMMAPGKGILAADESMRTADKRLASVNVEGTEENRRRYRNLFLSLPNLGDYLSGVILYEETLGQAADDGRAFIDILQAEGVLPGIKVDKSTVPLPGFAGEVVTEGLDGLPERLATFKQQGAVFTKWRAVIEVHEGEPNEADILADAHGLARYAGSVQEAGLVPMVEPEVLLTGSHTLEQSEATVRYTLEKVFEQLQLYKVDMAATILKTSMVVPGDASGSEMVPTEVAAATSRVLKDVVPEDLAGVVFLSGGQTPEQATANLAAISKLGRHPWPITFSYARALQGPALEVWSGDDANLAGAQDVFKERLEATIAARGDL